MSYHIYKTEGFVLDDYSVGESGKTFYIFTKEFGLIRASAQGIRKTESKLRYGLQKYSECFIWLVKGKNGWRITSVFPIGNFYYKYRDEQSKFLFLGRLFSLLKRLLQGEERNIDLFNILHEGLNFLTKIDEKAVLALEPLFVLRVLHNLGYVGSSVEADDLIKPVVWDFDSLDKSLRVRRKIISFVNQSLKESQL